MSSKRKKKMAAAVMAFTSVFGAKNSNAAPKAGSTAILENSGVQSLPRSENNNKKYSEKSQNTSNAPLIASTSLLTLLASGLIAYAAYSDNKKMDTDNTDDNKSKKHNNPGDILKKKDAKKVWENDPERIIKFITWYGGNDYPPGTCILNSYLNILLNPVLIEEINKLSNATNDSWFLSRFQNLKKIWDQSENHEFIKAEDPQHRTNFDNLYFGGDQLFAMYFPNNFPESFGTLGGYGTIAKAMENHVEKNKCPPLVFCHLAERYNDSLNSRPESVLKNPDSNKASYKLPNGRSYFVGGAILTCGGHTVFAHLLYDDGGTKLERVIVQDPNSSSNDNPDYYVREMQVENMQQLFVVNKDNEESEYNGYHIERLLMVRDDKFAESKYWKNSSLTGSIVSKF